jgi:Stress responsive A/B Barrel Domain
LTAALALATIPGVERFEQLRQVSPKSDFAFSFSMYFAGEDAYQAYNDHPTPRCLRPRLLGCRG